MTAIEIPFSLEFTFCAWERCSAQADEDVLPARIESSRPKLMQLDSVAGAPAGPSKTQGVPRADGQLSNSLWDCVYVRHRFKPGMPRVTE